MVMIYYIMKVAFFGSLVRSFVIYEPLRRHVIFLSLLYTGVVALLSFVFMIGPSGGMANYKLFELWKYWLGLNFLLIFVYFKLLDRFEDGVLFWVVLMLGVVVVLNEPDLLNMWLGVARGIRARVGI
jgi:hypothetical protein